MNSALNLLHGLMDANDGLLFKSEKINTVIIVVMVVWVGIAVYLILSGRKLSKLEKEVAQMKEQYNQKERESVEETNIHLQRPRS